MLLLCRNPRILSKPKSLIEQNWRIKIEDVTITDEQEIANEFNHFFINKIAALKENIPKERISDPLEKMKLPENEIKSKLK